jgi:tetratricopeptide (TPR) repeat protein
MRHWISLCQRIADDLSQNYQIDLPQITFQDRMTLDMGDLTLELIYFGPASSTGNIIVRIPEEGVVILGDLFHFFHVLPLSERDIIPDVPRWLDVLDEVLDEKWDLKYAVCSNSKAIWTRKELEARRDLIRNVYEKVLVAEKVGQDLQSLLDRFASLETEFPAIADWEVPQLIVGDIARTTIGIWRQSHLSTAEIVRQTLEEQGVEAAVNKFHDIQSSNDNRYYLTKGDFNRLGYELMRQEKIEEAIEIFRLNVEAFPDHWNGYDSLGEAFMQVGNHKQAVLNFQNSIELNPENNNAKEMLKRLRGE